MASLSEIEGLEDRAFRAWPALESEIVGAWTLRAAAGHTKRANSANPRLSGAGPEIVEVAEAFYAQRHLPCIFRITPLAAPQMDSELAARGYEALDSSWVMTASLAAAEPDDAIQVEASPSATWLDGFSTANPGPPAMHAVHQEILKRIPAAAGFATLCHQGERVGCGLAVFDRGVVGLYDIVVAPPLRRLGLGRTLTRAMMAWGAEQGAVSAYLQVRDVNLAARALYQGLGFSPAYGYHYRTAGS